jgi:uncharacterized membrane protein
MEISIIFALVAMLGFGITAVLYKIASKSLDAVSITFFALAINATVVLLMWVFFPNKEVSWEGAKYALIAGVIAGISSVAYISAIKLDSVSAAATIRALFFAVTVILAAIFLQEKFTITKAAGVATAIISIVLLSI